MHHRHLIVLVLVFHVITSYGQNRLIDLEGQITDLENHPVYSATVQIEGTNVGTVTDANGNFLIKEISTLPLVLTISHVNHTTKKIGLDSIKSGQTILIQLKPITHELKSVTVLGDKPQLVNSDVEVLKGIPFKVAEVPVSVQSISSDMIVETASQTLVEVLQRANGFTFNATTYNNLFARGFPLAPSNYLLDGQQGGTSGISAATQILYNVEEVQVIKGPTSAINGNAEPGALINIITKKPKPYDEVSVSATAGSFDFYEAVADVNLSLTESKLDTRWIMAYQNAGSFMELNGNENIFIAPSFNWRLSEKSNLLLTGSYLRRTGTGAGWHHRGILAIDNDLDRLPIEWTSHEESDGTENDVFLSLLQYDTRFESGLELTTQVRYQRDDFARFTHSAIAGSYDPSEGTIQREYADVTHRTDNLYLNTYLHKDFDFNNFHLHTILGVDYVLRQDDRTAQFYRGNVMPLNIDNPTYGNDDTNSYTLDRLDVRSEEPITSLGIYFQSNQRWSPKLMTMFSFRLNHVNQSSESVFRLQDRVSEYDQTLTAFNPTIGITYKVLPKTNLYANYSTGFQPQFAYRALVNFANVPENLDPEKTYQIETGVKQQFFEEKVLFTAAYYYIDKSNILGVDPENPDQRIPIDNAISQGLETSLTGRIKNFELVANYAYNDLKVDQNTVAATFHSSVNNPRHNFNLWASQSIPLGKFDLSVGGGANHWSDRDTNDESLTLPAFTTIDAMIGLTKEKTSIRLNFDNIFDQKYFTGGSSQYIIFPGEPFNMAMTVQHTF